MSRIWKGARTPILFLTDFLNTEKAKNLPLGYHDEETTESALPTENREKLFFGLKFVTGISLDF